jgi:hypothetical protein
MIPRDAQGVHRRHAEGVSACGLLGWTEFRRLIYRHSQLLRVYATVLVLTGDGNHGCARWERPDEMTERVSREDCGCGLTINHDDCSGFRRSLDFNDTPVLSNGRDMKNGCMRFGTSR